MQATLSVRCQAAQTVKASPTQRIVAAVPRILAGGLAAVMLSAGAANAATVKLGADSGALVFEPSSITIAKGESVSFVNNAGFPHNIVFDEDAVPEGVNAEAISREDYLNAPGETYNVKLDVAGSYSYYCEPHQGAGMAGKIIVQ